MVGVQSEVRGSELPFSIDDVNVTLAYDVICTGATSRAPMNELLDSERPRNVSLIERDGDKLTIHANICPLQLSLDPNEHVKLHGP